MENVPAPNNLLGNDALNEVLSHTDGPVPPPMTQEAHAVAQMAPKPNVIMPEHKTEVQVISPDGEVGSVPAYQADAAVAQGYTIATPEMVKAHELEQKYGSGIEQAKTFAEGALSGATFGGSTAAQVALGISTPEDIKGRREANPLAHGFGEGTGLAASAFLAPEVSAAKYLSTAGGAVAKGLAPVGKAAVELAKIGEKGAGLAARLGTKTAQEAVEMALFQGGSMVSKAITGDVPKTTGDAMAELGLAAVLGGGFGGLSGIGGELWNATKSSKLANVLGDFKEAAQKYDPLLKQNVTRDLQTSLDTTGELALRNTAMKREMFEKALPASSPEINGAARGALAEVKMKFEEMMANPKRYDSATLSNLERSIKEAEASIMPKAENTPYSGLGMFNAAPTPPPAEQMMALNKLKQDLHDFSKFDKNIQSPAVMNSANEMKSLSYKLKENLQDTKVWGDAGKIQGELNKVVSEYINASKDAVKRISQKVGNGRVIDADKIATLIKNVDKDKGEITRNAVKEYVNKSEQLIDEVNKKIIKYGGEPIEKPSYAGIRRILDGEKTEGGKLFDHVVNVGGHYLEHGATGSAIAGAAIGGGGVGGMAGALVHTLGARAAASMSQHGIHAVIPEMLQKAVNAKSFKSASDFITAAISGEKSAAAAIKNLFRGGVNEGISVKQSEIDKLKKLVDEHSINPEKLTSGEELAHYMPNHASAITQAKANAVNYLISLKPQTNPTHALDAKKPTNAIQMAEYNNALKIAQNPLYALKKMQLGTLTSKDMQHLNALYPSVVEGYKVKMMNEITNAQSKGTNIPHNVQNMMSLFMGMPLTSGFKNMPYIQNSFHTQGAGPQAAQPQSGTKSNITSYGAKALGKMPQNYLTGSQSLQMRNQRVK